MMILMTLPWYEHGSDSYDSWHWLSQVQCFWTWFEYTLHLVIRIEWWGPRRKVSGPSPVTFNNPAPFSLLWLHCQTRGVVRASTIGVLVRQGYMILCKKISGHCKFMQYYRYFHSDTSRGDYNDFLLVSPMFILLKTYYYIPYTIISHRPLYLY